MDLLSRLLALMPVTGSLDVRCHFGAPWRLELAASSEREIPYHVLLRGDAHIEDGIAPPVQMHAGDIVLYPSGAPHALRDDGGAPPEAVRTRRDGRIDVMTNDGGGPSADLLCGRFLLPAMPRQLWRQNLPARVIVRGDGAGREGGAAPDRLARLIALMREETLEHGPGSEALVDALSGALFALTLRRASTADDNPGGLLALAARARLQPALAAMLDAPERAWTLPELAARCHMSRATFARHFDDAIGRSASDVLTEIRMALASRLLARDGRATAEIGEAVGYQSDAAFQRAFKRHVGITPAQWRAQARQHAD